MPSNNYNGSLSLSQLLYAHPVTGEDTTSIVTTAELMTAALLVVRPPLFPDGEGGSDN